MKPLRTPLRVVFYKEDGRWVAHCLEFDICGDGDTHEEALASLNTAIGMQIEFSLKNNAPQNLFSPAGGEYFKMFAAGHEVACGELHVGVEPLIIERTEMREYSKDPTSDLAFA